MTTETLRQLLRRDIARLTRETDPATVCALRVRIQHTISAISKGEQ